MNLDHISPITIPDDLQSITTLLNRSFLPVAEQYHLSPVKAPANCAYITAEKIHQLYKDGGNIFKIEENNTSIATLTIRQRTDGYHELCRLGVDPDFQNRGYGKLLMQFGEHYLKQRQIPEVTLFLLADNTPLKKWYLKMGYTIIAERPSIMGDYNIIQMLKEL